MTNNLLRWYSCVSCRHSSTIFCHACIYLLPKISLELILAFLINDVHNKLRTLPSISSSPVPSFGFPLYIGVLKSLVAFTKQKSQPVLQANKC